MVSSLLCARAAVVVAFVGIEDSRRDGHVVDDGSALDTSMVMSQKSDEEMYLLHPDNERCLWWAQSLVILQMLPESHWEGWSPLVNVVDGCSPYQWQD